MIDKSKLQGEREMTFKWATEICRGALAARSSIIPTRAWNNRTCSRPLHHYVAKMFSSGATRNVSGGSSNEDKEREKHRDAEKEPLPEWPEGVNTLTGEKGGPKGPEPTRYGDWERKGRVSDF